MSDVVIRAEGLGKKYIIGHQAEQERYVALRDVLARQTRRLARSIVDLARGRPMIAGDELEEFWALREVSFEVRRGEVVGIIGRNGAGKSTLLKILARITEPSAGRVVINGRVASLLEVGTGFHPELTGRENIYLNGAILGMSRAEIRRKFDEIVAFAGVEKFLDTPVKRYSSGMYVRLAFSVAAHLEPDILVVDEVLAVGDAEFQKKCLGKMQDVAGHGRTVLFVSHNMLVIKSLCSNAVYFDDGSVNYLGDVEHAIMLYLDRIRGNQLDDLSNASRIGDGSAKIVNFRLYSNYGEGEVCSLDDICLEYGVEVDASELFNVNFSVSIKTIDGFTVTRLSTELGQSLFSLRRGYQTIQCFVKSFPLMPGTYTVNLSCDINGYFLDWIKDAGAFDVEYPREKYFHEKDRVGVLYVNQYWVLK